MDTACSLDFLGAGEVSATAESSGAQRNVAFVAGLLYPVLFLVISEPLMHNVSFSASKLVEKVGVVEFSEDLLILKYYYHCALEFSLNCVSRIQTCTYVL